LALSLATRSRVWALDEQLLGLQIEWRALGEISLDPLLPRLRQPRSGKTCEPLDAMGLALYVPAIDLDLGSWRGARAAESDSLLMN
jgi:hypothetical protein